MTLNPHPTFSSSGSYVLRLHRDARPKEGVLIGRVQHVASGEWLDFASSKQLLDWLATHSASLGDDSTQAPDTGEQK
ncbi:MAG: hypothetical protein JOY60_17220 [Burkholderiaceae bacterium]|nr:hypothetical protein [Roseateles sp.]MBV8471593.1 hypothetical protein [Burkholderiaceae bacterium]